MEGGEDRKVTLRKGDTIALPPNVPHTFRVVGHEVLRILGTHASPHRIVDYKDGGRSDARGYRVWTD
jgi:mannose-6-phosphate isomerase-like protein (cupin superfamily)